MTRDQTDDETDELIETLTGELNPAPADKAAVEALVELLANCCHYNGMN